MALGGRRDRLRYLLVIGGTAVGVGFLLAAAVIISMPTGAPICSGGTCTAADAYSGNPYTNPLLNQPGLHIGLATACILLVIPVLVFLGQCTRIGAARRNRRLAALRLAGATPQQVVLLTAADTTIAATIGAILGLFGFLALRAVVGAAQGGPPRTLPTDVPVPVTATVVIVVLAPILAGAAAVLAQRDVIVTPLRVFRRHRTDQPSAAPTITLAIGIALMALPAALSKAGLSNGYGSIFFMGIVLGVLLTVIGLLTSAAWLSGRTARIVARHTHRPALLLAARRLEADPYGQTRAMSTVLLCVLFASGVQIAVAQTLRPHNNDIDRQLYGSAFHLIDIAIGVAVVVAAFGLLVGTVESIIERQRSLSALVAAGTPQRTLGTAIFAQSILPMIPSVLLATVTGAALGTVFTNSSSDRALVIPWGSLALVAFLALAVPAGVIALSTPVLRQTVLPAELRYE
jgi:hypothetical protein